MCATNLKVQKKALLLLAKEDKKLQQERKYHESQGHAFVPSAVQAQNAKMWADAKVKMPEAAAQAEAAPQKRERISDLFKSQQELQDKLVQQYTQPNAIDTALMTMLQTFSQSLVHSRGVAHEQPMASAPQPTIDKKKQRLAELRQLLDDGFIAQTEYNDARMAILTKD